jgi:segregation and condensation protein A
LRDQTQIIFSDLFARAKSRVEIVVLFLALLELIRLKRLKVRQDEAFGEIQVIKVA